MEKILEENNTGDFLQWVRELKKQNSLSASIDFFVKTARVPVLFFEYQDSQSFLNLKHFWGLREIEKSLCLRLHESDSSFDPSQLYKPKQIPVFHSQVQKIFGGDEYQCFLLVFNKKVIGIFAYLSNSLFIKDKLFILSEHVKNFLWYKKWDQEGAIDELTGCLNEKHFLKQLFVEVSRARRIHLPLSLILLELDQFKDLKDGYGTYKPDVFMKTLVKHLIKDSRAYDIFGFWPEPGRLGIILPHTSERGASVKAEKIRWSIHSARFSKVFPDHEALTISLGLGEYPRVSRSADSLFRAALKALSFAHKECGGNITAVATPSVGFKPDFSFSNPVNHLRDLT